MRAETEDPTSAPAHRATPLGDVALVEDGVERLALRCLDVSEPSRARVPLSSALRGAPSTDPRASLRWDPEAARIGAAPLSVHERARLIVSLPPGASLGAYPGRARPLDAAGATQLLLLDGVSGDSSLAVTLGARRWELPLRVRARWAESFGALEAMLDEVASARWSSAVCDEVDAIVRPFGLTAGTRREPQEELLVLRAIAGSDALDAAVHAIARAPHADLRGAVLPVRASRARAVAPEDLATRAIAPGAPVPEDLTLRERRPVQSLDVPENRLVRAVLDALEARADALCAGPAEEAARALQGVFRRWRERLPWLDEVAPSLGSAPISPRRTAYEAFARAASLLDDAAPSLLARGAPDGVTVRDTASLYERWCALEVARALGADAQDAAALMLGRAIDAPWREGAVARILPQTRFEGPMPLAFRPDLTVARGARRVHLDAKYRLDPRAGDGSIARDELVKMHAYRDAIPGSVGAYALFPGAAGDALEGRDDRGGVGAIALLPLADEAARASQRARLREILYALLA